MKKIINDNGIINEGYIKLSYKERQQVEEMLPKIIKVISGKDLGYDNFKKIGVIDGVLADNKSRVSTTIYVGNDSNPDLKDANGYFNRKSRLDLSDNMVLITQRKFTKYFKGIFKFGFDMYKKLSGVENYGLELLRKTLKHELIHSKDPKMNQYYIQDKSYNKDLKSYFGSKTEFPPMTGQFLEAIIFAVDRAYNMGMEKDTVLSALNNLEMFYAGKVKYLSTEAWDFIGGDKTRNELQDLVKKMFYDIKLIVYDITKITFTSPIEIYDYYLKMIKQHNPKGYNKFLRELYKTIIISRKKAIELYKLDTKNKITITGTSIDEINSKLSNDWKNEYINPKSVEFKTSPNYYTLSFNRGTVKANLIVIMHEYTANAKSTMPFEDRVKILDYNEYFIPLKKDVKNPDLKWVVFIAT